MTDELDFERRIRQKAHEIWEQEGRPEGREREHWEKARVLVAIEDDSSGLIPVKPEPPVEEASIQDNLGEFPTALTDQGDRRQTPSRAAERQAAKGARAETATPPGQPKRARAPRKG
jgi:hypothetical protein